MTKVLELFKLKCESENFYFLSFLALVSGVLIGTSYIPYPPWALFFCYIPLWWAVLTKKLSYQRIFFLGWITQFTLTLIGFNWIYFTAREFGHLPVILSFLALILFAALMHIYIPLSLVTAAYLKNKFKLHTSAFIFVLCLCQILWERAWPSIFEWNLAYSLLWIDSNWAQWADVVGFWGLSAWIFIIQAILLYSFLNFRQRKKRTLIVLGLSTFILMILGFVGQQKKEIYAKTDSQIKVTLVQANISNEEKIQAEKGSFFHSYVINQYVQETEKELTQISSETDLIIWPETALPIALDQIYHDRLYQKNLLRQIGLWNKTLVTGAYSQDAARRDHLGNLLIRNSVFFLNPQGEVATPYYKTDLLAFGEYMPFGKEFPFLYQIFPFVGVYERGPGPVSKKIILSDLRSVQLGPQICYESLNPGFSRGLTQVGAEVFFNLTNDSWFGDWAEPYQHMIMTLARGLENRRPLIRSTNTGISTVILASGQILLQSPINQKWAHTYDLPFQKNPKPTLYSQIGYLDWILWVLILLILLFTATRERGNYARHKKS